ncbi:MAG: hypothetical protein JW812_00240 [Alphaproteobacteria bacterium]|nr:hypothetical protein [Alphaproteobacteria bacterium]MBN2779677.1 hypothetical protein [Alphaproteobacteria bacterium]
MGRKPVKQIAKAKISSQKASETRLDPKGFGEVISFDLDHIEKTLEQAKKVSEKYKIDPSKLVKPTIDKEKELKKQIMAHNPNRFGFKTLDN